MTEKMAKLAEDHTRDLHTITGEIGKGLRSLVETSVEVTQKSASNFMSHAQKLSSARDVSEIMNLQVSYAKDSFDLVTQQYGRLIGIAADMMGNIASPLAQSATRTVQTTRDLAQAAAPADRNRVE